MLNLDRLGYVFLGLSGGLLLFDKLFGVSAGWIRFISTAQNLEALLDSLRLDWAMLELEIGTQEVGMLRAKRLKALIAGTQRLHAIIGDETKAWVADFQSSLRELEQRASPKVKRE